MSNAQPGGDLRTEAGEARQPRLLYLVKRWYAATRSRLDEITRPYDLTAGDYTMLSFLKRLEPCSAAELSREQRISPQAATQQLAQLKAKNMVTSEENQANRRISLISMTPSGRASLAAISAEARLLEDEMMKDLSERDRAVVLAFLLRSIETAEGKGNRADGQ
jgi:DNA-binding MarR family transcriptional regulator